jgi:hypothetical protein
MTQIIPFEQSNLAVSKYANVIPLEKLGGVSGGFPIISIKGKVFTRVAGDEREIIMKKDEDGEGGPASSINVVILKQNPALSKVFYAGKYSEGSDEKPTCYSNNGLTPEDDSEEKQASKCSICPHNQWGSRITDSGGKGKACADSRRIAVAALGLVNDPMLMRVPAASLKQIDQYGDSLVKRQVPYQLVVTKIGFDYSVAHPALTFKPVGMVDEATADQIAEMLNEPIIDRILGLTPSVVNLAQIAKAEREDPPAQAETPVKAEKVAEPAKVEDEVDPEVAALEAALAAKKAAAKKPKVEKPAEPTPEELAAKAKAEKMAKLKAEMEALEKGGETEAVAEEAPVKPLKTKAASATIVEIDGDLADDISGALDELNFDDES